MPRLAERLAALATAALTAAAIACGPASPPDVVLPSGAPAPRTPLAIAGNPDAARAGEWTHFVLEPRFATDDDADGDYGCGADVAGGYLTLGDEGAGWTVADARACEQLLHARHWDRGVHVGVDPFRVFVSDVAVGSGAVAIFALSPSCAAIDGACRNDFEATDWAVLSVVGPVVSVAAYRATAGGGGPPYHHEAWTTVDLRTGKPAALDALVTEASLLAALKASPEVAELLDDGQHARLRDARSLRDAIDAWEVASATYFGSYAFVEDGATGPHVTMRLGVLWSMNGMSPNFLERVDLNVEIRAEAAAWLDAARAGRGFLASRWPDTG